MSTIPDAELSLLSEGAKLSGMLPYLGDAIEKMERALENKVFAMLDKDELSPQLAVYAWQEKQILRRLLQRMNQKVRVGTAFAQKYEQELTIGGN